LLGSPASISVPPHVGGRFNLRQEFERAVTEANNSDDGTRNDTQHMALDDDASDENVDWCSVRYCTCQVGYV